MFNFVVNFFTEPCFTFSTFGKFAAFYIAFIALIRAWKMFRNYILSPYLGLATDVKEYGEWAVVTGSTDGIGKAYAIEMAKKGMKLVLVSRTASRLDQVAKEIEEKVKGAKVKVVEADFKDINCYDDIQKQLQELDIGVLVNNVGMSQNGPDFFHNCPADVAKNILIVNTFSIVLMTKMVIEGMRIKKKGLIINISSFSGHIPCPMLAIYSSTKAFMRSFSRSIEKEYVSDGIVVQCLCPSLVVTKMSRVQRETFFALNPTTYVSSAMATIGIDQDVNGCISHDLTLMVGDLLGEKMAMGQILRIFMNSKRKRELRIQEGIEVSKEQ